MQKSKFSFLRGLILTLLVFALLFCLAYQLIDKIGATSHEAQTELVEKAVMNALSTCYAVEGAYPASVDYLRENYGLAYDESQFIVHYEAFASNILPDVWVNVRGDSGL